MTNSLFSVCAPFQNHLHKVIVICFLNRVMVEAYLMMHTIVEEKAAKGAALKGLVLMEQVPNKGHEASWNRNYVLDS